MSVTNPYKRRLFTQADGNQLGKDMVQLLLIILENQLHSPLMDVFWLLVDILGMIIMVLTGIPKKQ